MSRTCFHCGLAVTEAHPPITEVFGDVREFCCAGCLAVCHAIMEAGHEDYYRFREQPAKRAGDTTQTSFVKQLELYDRPEIQQGFVRSNSNGREASLILEEIRCAACLWLNERHLRTLEGVLDVQMDYTSQRARVRWDPNRIRLSQIISAITEIGYTAYPFDPSHRATLDVARKRRGMERIIFAGVLGMVVMNFSLATYLLGDPDELGHYPLWVVIGRWTTLIATSAILVYPGQEFFLGAWRDLRSGRLGMDIPIVLGLSIAYIGSLHATITRTGEVYYDSIAMFVFLLLLARYLELKGRIAAADSLDHLTKVVPATACRIGALGDEEIPVVELQSGDRIRVLPGETVPVDGMLLEGTSSFNESLLTGESAPIEKGIGEQTIAGSINADQPVVIQVTRGSDESTLSEITRLAERGLRSRPRYTELAEKAAVGFVAAILVIAALTTLAWMHLDASMVIHNLVAVLIVTCPCALALATPVAMTLSAARITDLGIVPMRMSALEPFATGRVVAFDKTGTLTLGRPSLEVVIPLHALTATEAKRIAASLEQYSEHPFAHAFRHAYDGQLRSIDSFWNHASAGIEGWIDGACWRIGKPEFILTDRPIEDSLWRKIQALRGTGHSVVLLADNHGPQALFGLTDPPRPSIHAVLAKLRHEGVKRFVILSGDHPDNVARLAADLNIEEFHGSLTPVDKLNWIKQTQSQGQQVIMVGDGINDAPVLAAADASLSFSDATNAAQMSSDFVLIRSTLEALSQARAFARRSRRTILQNLLWAAAYNLSAVPLAALGFVPPWAAAIGMSMSSLLVIGNSMRLRRATSREHPRLAARGFGNQSGVKLPTKQLDVA